MEKGPGSTVKEWNRGLSSFCVLLDSRLFRELLICEPVASVSAPLLLKAAMMKLIAYYIEHAASGAAGVEPAAVSMPLQAVIEHIHLHYDRSLTIDELAERAHLHPNYFIRVFKRHFGTSPIQYVNRKKD